MTTTMRFRVRTEAAAQAALKSGERSARREGSHPGDGSNGPSTAGSVLSVEPPQPELLPERRTKPLTWVVIGAVALGIAGGVTYWAVSDGAPSHAASGAPTSLDATASSTTSLVADPASAPAPSATSPRSLRVETDPPGATVALAHKRLCEKTPCDVVWTEIGAFVDGGPTLKISLAGYDPAEVGVSAEQDKILTKLIPTRARPVGAPPPGTKPPGDEPFKLSPY
jgi:hypothetical protein